MLQVVPENNKGMLFQAKDAEALVAEIRETYGENVGRILERVDVKSLSVDDQKAVVTELKNAGLNGNAESLFQSYTTHQQELARRAALNERWYSPIVRGAQTVGSGLREVVLAPFKAVRWAFTNHPIMSTVAVTALLAFLGYYYGIPLAQFAGEGGDERTGAVAETLRTLTQGSGGGELPGIGEAQRAIPTYPSFDAPTIPLPQN
jgi:hypothetical protein